MSSIVKKEAVKEMAQSAIDIKVDEGIANITKRMRDNGNVAEIKMMLGEMMDFSAFLEENKNIPNETFKKVFGEEYVNQVEEMMSKSVLSGRVEFNEEDKKEMLDYLQSSLKSRVNEFNQGVQEALDAHDLGLKDPNFKNPIAADLYKNVKQEDLESIKEDVDEKIKEIDSKLKKDLASTNKNLVQQSAGLAQTIGSSGKHIEQGKVFRVGTEAVMKVAQIGFTFMAKRHTIDNAKKMKEAAAFDKFKLNGNKVSDVAQETLEADENIFTQKPGD